MPDRVQLLDELQWGFHDAVAAPRLTPKLDIGGRYTSGIAVDPFPAYAHDLAIARAELERVTAAFPLPEPFAPTIFVLSHEVLSRTNGQANLSFDNDWVSPSDDEDNQRPWRGYIALSGKRIPPHPAMTRYLVAHEYGHIVEDWLIRQRRERAQTYDLLREYADRRGMSPTKLQLGAGGGTWHLAIQEIFANDFRILRAETEAEFWPHPGVDRPEGIEAIVDFWRTAH